VIEVTKHAIMRFKQRRMTDKPEEVVKEKILNMLTFGREVQPVNKVASLLYNRMKEAKYFQSGDLVCVLVGDTVVTVSKNLKGKWRAKDGD